MLAVVTAAVGLMVSVTGCDSRQHLATSGGFQVSASADDKAVIPEGWRRTKFGWEHTSTWGIAKREPTPSIDHWITRTSNRVPSWSRGTLSGIRDLSPITLALCQILAIACIVRLQQYFQTDAASEESN